MIHNKIKMFCNVCGKPYLKLIRPTFGKTGIIRPVRCITCSKKCSGHLLMIKRGNLNTLKHYGFI